MHLKVLPARSADCRLPGEVGAEIPFASIRRWLELHPDNIVAAFRVSCAPAEPHGNDVKFSAEVKPPGIEDSREPDEEERSENEDYDDLPKAAEAPSAAFARGGLTQSAVERHLRSSGNRTTSRRESFSPVAGDIILRFGEPFATYLCLLTSDRHRFRSTRNHYNEAAGP